MAHDIAKRLESGNNAQEAVSSAVGDLTQKLNNKAGAITISKCGDVGVHFTNLHMPWAYIKKDALHFGAAEGEHNVECIE